MDLSEYKKVWKNQPNEKNKVSAVEIYKMTQAKSTSIVKWIFIISILEFIILNSLYFFMDMEKMNERYNEIGLNKFVLYFQGAAYIVTFFFIILFYKNYKNISVVDSTKNLMSKILKVRKTVKLYVLFNLTLALVTLIVVTTKVVTQNAAHLPSTQIAIIILLTFLFGIVFLAVVWLFYQLLYGILLKKLKRNYKELSYLEQT